MLTDRPTYFDIPTSRDTIIVKDNETLPAAQYKLPPTPEIRKEKAVTVVKTIEEAPPPRIELAPTPKIVNKQQVI